MYQAHCTWAGGQGWLDLPFGEGNVSVLCTYQR